MPTVVCPRCDKQLESDMYDADGNVTAPSHMRTGLTRWCEAPIEQGGDPGAADLDGDGEATKSGRDAPETGHEAHTSRYAPGVDGTASGPRRATVARIERLRERARRIAHAFGERMDRRRRRGA